MVFHAGTRAGCGGWETNGGRCLTVCATGADLAAASAAAYRAAEAVNFDGKQMRRDIGRKGE